MVEFWYSLHQRSQEDICIIANNYLEHILIQPQSYHVNKFEWEKS